ncbi:MAG: formate dehydrogenase accessory sulfurtransferase FdhD [Candidatus Omnitrophota bacterium]|nr:MAG: formate dehydrogenase accessory sulfurtransferase FdhD [Candidatus Omnitrophota bacterium]
MKILRQISVTEKAKITRITKNTKRSVKDSLVNEIPLKIVVNGRKLLTLMCLPADLEDLVYGFLFSSGIIRKPADIKKLVINKHTANVRLAASCKIKNISSYKTYSSSGSKEITTLPKTPKIVTAFKISFSDITALMDKFLNTSGIYSKTGGVHSAALTDGRKILIFKDDVGRHNAIDKVIGCMLTKNIPFHNKAIITSGRISSEIVSKIQKCAIPVAISKSAVTTKAVVLAKKGGLTLVKANKNSSLNVYCNETRMK